MEYINWEAVEERDECERQMKKCEEEYYKALKTNSPPEVLRELKENWEQSIKKFREAATRTAAQPD